VLGFDEKELARTVSRFSSDPCQVLDEARRIYATSGWRGSFSDDRASALNRAAFKVLDAAHAFSPLGLAAVCRRFRDGTGPGAEKIFELRRFSVANDVNRALVPLFWLVERLELNTEDGELLSRLMDREALGAVIMW